MNKILATLAFSISLSLATAQKAPEVDKTAFSTEVLSQKIVAQNGEKVEIKNILEQHKGKILIIDFWASWCRDCILALPKTNELKELHPEIQFVYFSVDRSDEQWKRGLEKYNLDTFENYWFDEGWKNPFNNYIELNWVPRFLVVDQSGKIAKYYAISPEDPDLLNVISQLKTK